MAKKKAKKKVTKKKPGNDDGTLSPDPDDLNSAEQVSLDLDHLRMLYIIHQAAAVADYAKEHQLSHADQEIPVRAFEKECRAIKSYLSGRLPELESADNKDIVSFFSRCVEFFQELVDAVRLSVHEGIFDVEEWFAKYADLLQFLGLVSQLEIELEKKKNAEFPLPVRRLLEKIFSQSTHSDGSTKEALLRELRELQATMQESERTDAAKKQEDDRTPAGGGENKNGGVFSIASLRRELGIGNTTLNRYAKEAVVQRPSPGQKNYRYPRKDVVKICQWIIANVNTEGIVSKANALLSKLK